MTRMRQMKHANVLDLTFLLGVFVASRPLACRAETLTVGPAGSSAEYTDIQSAIDEALDGDEVIVQAGQYEITESITFKGKELRVRSEAGPAETTIRMLPGPTGAPSVFRFVDGERGSSELEGFTLTGGGDRDEVVGNPLAVRNDTYGAGVYCQQSSPTLRHCIITRNMGVTRDGGSGVFCRNASPVLIDCDITYNVHSHGGGVYCTDGSFPTFENCTIASNIGGGLFCNNGSRPELFNCTIAGNLAADFGSDSRFQETCETEEALSNRDSGVGLRASRAFPTLVDCIVWGNQDGSIVSDEFSDVAVVHSCVEGPNVWPGIGNINDDPLFCGWETDEVLVRDQREFERALEYRVRLSDASPCLGAGERGGDIGAQGELCGTVGSTSRLLRLSAGRYRMTALNLADHVSLQGAGEGQTILEGTVWAPRTGAYLADLTITGGRASGLRVYGRDAPEIRNCTITMNSTRMDDRDRLADGFHGGGVFCGEGTAPRFTSCTITKNFALNKGGGFYCKRSSPTLIGCTIAGNLSGQWAGGGGIHIDQSDSDATLLGCWIMGNASEFDGGGVRVLTGNATLANCVIAGNRSLRSGGGLSLLPWFDCSEPDGIWTCVDCGNVTRLINCTIAFNSAKEKGALECDAETHEAAPDPAFAVDPFEVTNSISWGNRTVREPSDALCGDVDRNIWREDPLFVNEGRFDFTRTIPVSFGFGWLPNFIVEEPDLRLQEGSPAIDAGRSDVVPDTDIEHNARLCGDRVDLGAHESCPPPTESPFRRGDASADGSLNLSDGMFLLNFLFGQGPSPACRDAADTDDEGTIAISDAIGVFNYLFSGETPPPSPGPVVCGVDPTPDRLGCEVYDICDR